MLLLPLFSVVLGCNRFPDDTQSVFNRWLCGASPGISVFTMKPVNPNGILTRDLKIDVVLENDRRVYDALHLEIKIWSWGRRCRWAEVPTFGLLSNQKACKTGFPCPLKMGNQSVTLLSTKYGFLISLLPNNAAYQIQYKITASNGDICIMAQARAHSLAKNATSFD
ncbi:hypothetical protein L596_007753 [Steinernema carpocapsae]|uniref:MD-2-related lipid-recognition domain-containing protein n=1 Tax=Steinernema carpocapsae TaxID=34508 RepID=A0A4U5PAV6_STECR|nr:hypothetical protein L596_007753 [Steinernema carpocapsae]